jgi:hypothetical protein
MLLIGDVHVESGSPGAVLLDAILGCPVIQHANQEFLAGMTVIPRSYRSLCIFQGEQAMVRIQPPAAVSTAPTMTATGRPSDDNSARVEKWQRDDLQETDPGARGSKCRQSLFIGSEDATTCMIVIVLDRNAGVAWAGHFDEPLARSAEASLMFPSAKVGCLGCSTTTAHSQSWGGAAAEMDTSPTHVTGRAPTTLRDLVGEEHSHPADLYLVGGYDEPSGTSRRVSQSLLSFLHSVPRTLHLQLACIGRSVEGAVATSQASIW